MSETTNAVWVCRVRGLSSEEQRNGCIGTSPGVEERMKQGEPNPVVVRPSHAKAGCGWYVPVTP